MIEAFEEFGDRLKTARDIRVGGELNQFAEAGACAIEDGRQLQAAAGADRGGQFDAIGGGGAAGEDVIGDGPEGEDVEVFAESVAGKEDVGGHVGGGRVVDEVADVRGGGDGGGRSG